MPPCKVVIFRAESGRAKIVTEAMYQGIRACGDTVTVLPEGNYREPCSQVAVFYGQAGKLKNVLADYVRAGKTCVYIDLGYWGRHQGGRRAGFHKLVVNNRHPTAYYRTRPHRADRFARFNLAIEPWRKGGKNILVAGLSTKGSLYEGFAPMQWELDAIAHLRKLTERPIMYRPKPTCKGARPLSMHGILYSPPTQELGEALRNAYCVVSHHSNVNIEGILQGVPSITLEGVGADMSATELAGVNALVYPDGREQWAADIAFTQFNVEEMRQGVPWRHLKDEGLIP